MTTGRKPKPTAAKRRAGNPGHRPLNDREPQIPHAIPPCPRTLSADAKRHWKPLAIRLLNAGIVTELDQSILAVLCIEWSTLLKAQTQLTRHGLVALTAGGSYKPSPYIAIANAATANILRILPELGMTPSSRSRVKTAEWEQLSLADVLFLKTEKDEKSGQRGGPR